MSQMPGTQDVAVHLNPASVTSYFQGMQQRDVGFLENIKTCKEAVLEAAALYVDEHDDEKLKKLRQQLLQLVEAQQQVQAHRTALQVVAGQYAPTLEKSNFEQMVQEAMDEAPRDAHPERDEDVADFDNITGLSGAAAGNDEELDEDEELVVVGGAEKNEKCPYTMKLLIDLQEPVEDHKGFVYEAAAIKDNIRRNHGRIECPVAGASHWIQLSDLKPCRRVLRMQKHRQRHPGAGQQTQTQAPRAAGGRVLDI
ncbi:hypothetical protein OEZ86_007785 [Tetradesmus obliquus]|nr:hypothetical protein OEZ86_007785 [Tetradesmus obliquus]